MADENWRVRPCKSESESDGRDRSEADGKLYGREGKNGALARLVTFAWKRGSTGEKRRESNNFKTPDYHFILLPSSYQKFLSERQRRLVVVYEV